MPSVSRQLHHTHGGRRGLKVLKATERALALHPQGCPAHQSVRAAIAITWDATLRAGDHVVSVHGEPASAETA